MRFSIFLFTLITAGIFLICSCGKNGATPVAPSVEQSSLYASETSIGKSNRHLFGLWKVTITEDRTSAEVVPLRSARMHLNMVHTLENKCADCLTVDNLQTLPDNNLIADLTLKHPFPGQKNITGFDVRGIFISEADFTFPASQMEIALGENVPRLLNPDGYTRLFNPADFPETVPPILGYTQGHYAPGGDLTAKLNPFVAYEVDVPRRAFFPGTVSTRTVQVKFPEGSMEFGYAIDASWMPAGVNVIDPIEDFPISANCAEPYLLVTDVGPGLSMSSNGQATVQVLAYDHQDPMAISSVSVEAPTIFDGIVELSLSSVEQEGYAIFTGTIYNDHQAELGEYPMLVKAESVIADQNLGNISAWNLFNLKVKDAEGWGRSWGSEKYDRAFDVVTDSEGNVYITGEFEQSVDFDPGPGEDWHHENFNNGYYGDAYLTSFDRWGNFRWVRTWGGHGQDYGTTLTINEQGNIAVGGVAGDNDFIGPVEVPTYWHPIGLFSYIFKFTSEGDFCPDPIFILGHNIRCQSLEIDAWGNHYICGWFQMWAGPSPESGDEFHSTEGSVDSVLLNYSPDGEYLWSSFWGSNLFDETASDCDIDEWGNVYVTGLFNGEVDFDPGDPMDLHISSGVDKYLCKYSSDGEFLWARTWDGKYAGNPSDIKFVRPINRVAVGPDPYLYVSGYFKKEVDFDPGPGEDIKVSAGSGDNYIMVFETDGSYEKTITWGGPKSDYISSITYADNGNLYIAGGIFGYEPVDLDPGPGVFWVHPDTGESYILKLDSDLNFEWVTNWGHPDHVRTYGLKVDESSYIYAAGYFGYDFSDFDPGPDVDIHIPYGGYDACVIKFSPSGTW